MAKFQRTLKPGKNITWTEFIRTRLLTPKELWDGFKTPVFPPTSLGRILFNARYQSGKALEGWDYVDIM